MYARALSRVATLEKSLLEKSKAAGKRWFASLTNEEMDHYWATREKVDSTEAEKLMSWKMNAKLYQAFQQELGYVPKPMVDDLSLTESWLKWQVEPNATPHERIARIIDYLIKEQASQ
jgi:hypothetical protein